MLVGLPGSLLLESARTLLTGPYTGLWGAARSGDTASVAQTLNIKEVNRYIIAFILTGTHWALSSLRDWALKFEHFDFAEFYNNVVEMLESDSEFEGEILTWYNERIPGLQDVGRQKHALQEPLSPQPDPIALAKAQRQQRKIAEEKANQVRAGQEGDGATHAPAQTNAPCVPVERVPRGMAFVIELCGSDNVV
ncbi:hypothetical protein BKA70DRAFT_1440409 [Coprinopsis sp. MPI-PUGE-AT-0042]|nr:hypothetical protein BKA70DRAFT_1440409 [Coprinopsis sp. MPI-PUGE-AT-0042]